MSRLNRDFFERCPRRVAPELLGCRLVHRLGTRERVVGVIVEVEAYLGDGSDPGSHSHNGETARNASMFGAPGRFYVYRSMGIHACANLVCQPNGIGAAVLLRAVEPVEGEVGMTQRRSGRTGRELTNGPGKLTQAFAIGLDHDGSPALSGELCVLPPLAREAREILAGPRIGLSKGVELRYRYFLAEHPYVTRSPLNRAARPL